MLPNELQLSDQNRYGKLLGQDIKLFRQYFEEMVRLYGIQVIYYAPRPDKHYTTYAEISSNYQSPEIVGVLFDEYPDQKSMKKAGWNVELQENASIIHVPYNLHDIQAGALFLVPSGLDHARGRLFRVTQLVNGIIYPASISCELVPEYEDTLPKDKRDYSRQDFNLLRQEDGDHSF